MKLENILRVFKPLSNSKIAGGILLTGIIATLPLTIAEVRVTDSKVNEIYNEYGGTNNTLSTYDKVDFIRAQTQFSSTNKYAKFLDRVKPIE